MKPSDGLIEGCWVRPLGDFSWPPVSNWGSGMIEQFLPDNMVKVRYAYTVDDPDYGWHIHSLVSLVETDWYGQIT